MTARLVMEETRMGMRESTEAGEALAANGGRREDGKKRGRYPP